MSSAAFSQFILHLPVGVFISVSTLAIVTFLHAPYKVQAVAPEKIGDKPDGTEEPPLWVAEETGHFYGYVGLRVCVVQVRPDLPSIVLQNLVVHQAAKVEEVAQRGHKNQTHTAALERLEVLPFDQKSQRDQIGDRAHGYQHNYSNMNNNLQSI